ncbi:hypothetical protein Y032_0039g126 [Ancylostoma ceylanicum]|nr:hypothetical protein Y032_0039g126 [Ancylostoma ceylanicum]
MPSTPAFWYKVSNSLLEQIYVQRRISPLILSIGEAKRCSIDGAAVANSQHSYERYPALLLGSGQDRYGVMNRVYYKDAHGAVVVMDVSRERTKEGACRWKNDLDQKVLLADGSQVPAVLVINKCDLDVNIDEKNLKELEEENRFIGVVRTSAKENYGIDEAILTVLRRVLENEKKGRYEASFPNSEGNVRIGDDKRQQKKKYGGCC